MRERDIEKELRLGIEARGGKCYKFVSPGNAGVPDRLVMVPGWVFLVEVKAPGKRPTKLQAHVAEEMRAAGGDVQPYVDTMDKVAALLRRVDMLS